MLILLNYKSSVRHFRTDSMVVHKGIVPWKTFSSASGVSFSDLKSVYAATATSQGLVHAMAGSPILSSNKYTVRLYPVGLRYDPLTVTSEEVVKAAAHGILHGLAALHKVNIGHPSLKFSVLAYPNTFLRNSGRWALCTAT